MDSSLERLEGYDQTAMTNVLTTSGRLDAAKTETEIHLPDGRTVRVPTALLLGGNEPVGESAFRNSNDALAAGEMTRIPVVEERLEIGKRTLVTGKVLLEKQVQEYDEALDVPLAVRSYDIERVVLNRPVETAPGVRQEGETTIYPLVEEQLVLTTQLVLKEEVHVTRRDTERRDTRTVTLKRESMVVTREEVEAVAAETTAGPRAV